jgi:hypothetical protein
MVAMNSVPIPLNALISGMGEKGSDVQEGTAWIDFHRAMPPSDAVPGRTGRIDVRALPLRRSEPFKRARPFLHAGIFCGASPTEIRKLLADIGQRFTLEPSLNQLRLSIQVPSEHRLPLTAVKRLPDVSQVCEAEGLLGHLLPRHELR